MEPEDALLRLKQLATGANLEAQKWMISRKFRK
jgi:hypothetical protein